MDFNEAVDFGVTADSGERMDFDGALDFLEQRSGRGSVMGLDSIRNLLRELSDPQKDLEFVHSRYQWKGVRVSLPFFHIKGGGLPYRHLYLAGCYLGAGAVSGGRFLDYGKGICLIGGPGEGGGRAHGRKGERNPHCI